MTSNPTRAALLICLIGITSAWLAGCTRTPRATGDLGVIIERAAGRLVVIETTGSTILARVPGLGDTSHASVVY
jgi:protein NirF